MGRGAIFDMARILIAESNETMRRLLKALIESHSGWHICGEAVNGHDAVAKATALKPDLIILDLAMEGLNGFNAARQISAASPAMPIVLHTLHDFAELTAEAKKYGIRQVVSKHESGDVLIRAIETHLEDKPQGVAAMLDELALTAVAGEAELSAEQAEEMSDDGDEGPRKPN